MAISQDPIVEAVREDLLRRSELGLKKYGRAIAAGGYSHRDLLQHAYEEALDLANYLKGAILKADQEAEVRRKQEEGVMPGELFPTFPKTPEQQRALDAYWTSGSPEQEREAIDRMKAAGLDITGVAGS